MIGNFSQGVIEKADKKFRKGVENLNTINQLNLTYTEHYTQQPQNKHSF